LPRSPAELERLNERLMIALKASRCGTWRWDIAEDRVEWDEALLAVYRVAPGDAPKTAADFLALIHPEDRERVLAILQDCLQQGSEVEYEFRAIIGDRTVWIYDRSRLVNDADGRPLYMTGACLDVTERKRVEQERDQALEKHRWFLKELNHRTKNHLQMITAMLSLQARFTVSEEAQFAFDRAIRRINVIADLHARLYRDETVEWVNAADYLRDICDGLRRSLLTDSGIQLDCKSVSALLSLDQAVPMGLIVNELVTNAIKHAYPEGKAGRIEVSFAVNGEAAELTVADDGRGLGHNATLTPAGLGHRLVSALAAQLGADLQVASASGTQHRLVFPAAAAPA
jgi:two-component sensor histidine kinase